MRRVLLILLVAIQQLGCSSESRWTVAVGARGHGVVSSGASCDPTTLSPPGVLYIAPTPTGFAYTALAAGTASFRCDGTSTVDRLFHGEVAIVEVRPAARLWITAPSTVEPGATSFVVLHAADASGAELDLGDDCPVEWAFHGQLAGGPDCVDIIGACLGGPMKRVASQEPGPGEAVARFNGLEARQRIEVVARP